jgi:hypothetical protein
LGLFMQAVAVAVQQLVLGLQVQAVQVAAVLEV